MLSQMMRSFLYISCIRLALVLLTFTGYWYSDVLQFLLDEIWLWLRENTAYKSVVFESVFTAFLGGFITGMYWLVEHNPYWNVVEKYSNRDVKMHTLGPLSLAKWAFKYMFIFLVLDFVTPKRYGHVDPKRYEEREGYLHVERLLPVNAPSLGTLLYECCASLVLYDAIFFVIHVALHRIPFLYRHIHRHHHDQQFMTAYETDHLHPMERVLLVGTGNEALRIVGAHPLSRNVFNVWLIYLLFNNHCGLDFPISLEKIIPFNVMYGPADHELHHMLDGRSHYQPFFRYLDQVLEWLQESPDQGNTLSIDTSASSDHRSADARKCRNSLSKTAVEASTGLRSRLPTTRACKSRPFTLHA